MTEENKKLLQAAHAEELADVKKYHELAEKMINSHAEGILCDIAHEESTHAELLEHILEMED